jgi:hypothetical protein
MSLSESRTYSGGCHCGRVRYEIVTALTSAVDCNCSMCSKRGALWSYVGADDFKLLSGADALTDYQFNKKIIHHLFCSTCGIASFARGRRADGSEAVGINVRCLDGVDLAALTLTPYDGRSR